MIVTGGFSTGRESQIFNKYLMQAYSEGGELSDPEYGGGNTNQDGDDDDSSDDGADELARIEELEQEAEDLALENTIFESYYKRNATEGLAEGEEDKRRHNRCKLVLHGTPATASVFYDCLRPIRQLITEQQITKCQQPAAQYIRQVITGSDL